MYIVYCILHTTIDRQTDYPTLGYIALVQTFIFSLEETEESKNVAESLLHKHTTQVVSRCSFSSGRGSVLILLLQNNTFCIDATSDY